MSLQTRLEALVAAVGADIKVVKNLLVTIPIYSNGNTAITLAVGDQGQVLETTAASAVTVTIPPNSTQAFPLGTMIEIAQLGTGQITFTPGAGVTIRSRGNAYKMAGQYGVAYIRKRATDEWIITGDLVV